MYRFAHVLSWFFRARAGRTQGILSHCVRCAQLNVHPLYIFSREEAYTPCHSSNEPTYLSSHPIFLRHLIFIEPRNSTEYQISLVFDTFHPSNTIRNFSTSPVICMKRTTPSLCSWLLTRQRSTTLSDRLLWGWNNVIDSLHLCLTWRFQHWLHSHSWWKVQRAWFPSTGVHVSYKYFHIYFYPHTHTHCPTYTNP